MRNWILALSPKSGAALGLLLGVSDTVLLRLLGVRFYLGEARSEVSLAIGAFFTCSFVALGYLWGQAQSARRAERAQAALVERQLFELGEQQARLAEQEKLASLGQLAGAIAHEVRNPLAIIRSTVQNISEALPEDDELGQESCTFALEEIDRLTKVSASLVSFIRPLKLKRERVRAQAILDRTEQLAQRLFADRPVRLRAEPGEGLSAHLSVDPDMLCQVLLGLLSNAASVSPDGAQVRLRGVADGEHIEFSVIDEGPGVPEEMRERIFEPFFTTREQGAGLGLAIARQIISAHGGTLEVGAAGSGGARFCVRLAREAA